MRRTASVVCGRAWRSGRHQSRSRRKTPAWRRSVPLELVGAYAAPAEHDGNRVRPGKEDTPAAAPWPHAHPEHGKTVSAHAIRPQFPSPEPIRSDVPTLGRTIGAKGPEQSACSFTPECSTSATFPGSGDGPPQRKVAEVEHSGVKEQADCSGPFAPIVPKRERRNELAPATGTVDGSHARILFFRAPGARAAREPQPGYPPCRAARDSRRARPGRRTRQQAQGDGATPRGRFRLLRLWWRPDRHARPQTTLAVRRISPDLAWCEDPQTDATIAPSGDRSMNTGTGSGETIGSTISSLSLITTFGLASCGGAVRCSCMSHGRSAHRRRAAWP